MNIYSKNIYQVVKNNLKNNILIIYNVSDNHYVGLPVYSENNNNNNLTYIESLKRFIDINDLQEYTKKNIKRLSLC